jgi:hypothetical protein
MAGPCCPAASSTPRSATRSEGGLMSDLPPEQPAPENLSRLAARAMADRVEASVFAGSLRDTPMVEAYVESLRNGCGASHHPGAKRRGARSIRDIGRFRRDPSDAAAAVGAASAAFGAVSARRPPSPAAGKLCGMCLLPCWRRLPAPCAQPDDGIIRADALAAGSAGRSLW